MEVKKPIFILGTGRSGSTIFHEVLSNHRELYWFSAFLDRYPQKPHFNKWAIQATSIPLFGNFVKRKVKAIEPYIFWDHCSKGFSVPCRDLESGDVSHKTKKRVKDIFEKLYSSGRQRILSKITGWPRIGFLHEIFDDALFIHIVRDGRAVANSYLNVPWWHGWQGPSQWRWGLLPENYMEEWESHQRSFIALAAIEWKIILDATEKAKSTLTTDNFLEIRYEDFCVAPVETMRQVTEFADLNWTTSFEKDILAYNIKNTNYKYQEELNPSQIAILEKTLAEKLKQYKYSN